MYNLYARIKDFIDLITKHWNIDKLLNTVPTHILHRIRGVPIPVVFSSENPIWAPNPGGYFTIKSTYLWHHALKYRPVFPQLPWRILWKIKCPPKIKFFFWQILNDTLCMTSLLHDKFYYSKPLLHLVWCNTVFCIALYIIISKERSTGSNLISCSFFFRHYHMHEAVYVKTLFTLWHIWLARNNAICRNSTIDCYSIIHCIETIYLHFTAKLHGDHTRGKLPRSI